MVDGPGEGRRLPQHLARSRGGRRGTVYSRLSILALDEEGSGGGANLRHQAEPVAAHPPVRDDVKRGRGRPRKSCGGDHPVSDAGNGGGLRTDHVGSSRDGEGRDDDVLSPLAALGRAELPDVSHRHRAALSLPASVDSDEGLRDGSSLLADELEECNRLSLERTKEILGILLDPDNENYQANLRAINTAIGNTFTMSARTNDTAFRRHALDRLPEILRLIKEEEKNLPGVLIEAAVL